MSATGERTTSKRLFPRTKNILIGLIKGEDDVDIIESRFCDLKKLLSAVQSSHEKYIQELGEAVDEETLENEDTWIIDVEKAFQEIELQKYEYCNAVRMAKDQQIQEENERKFNETAQRQHERNLRDVERLLQLRNLEELTFNKYDDFFKQLERPPVGDLYILKDFHEQIKSQFVKCKDALAQYTSLLSKQEADDQMKWISKVQTKRSLANEEFGKYLEIRERTEKAGAAEGRKRDLQLQPMNLPKFDGNLRNYPRFKSDFIKLIHPRMKDNETRCYVLKSCLSSEPLSLVKNLDSLDECWERLDSRYGRASRLVERLPKDVRREWCKIASKHGSSVGGVKFPELLEFFKEQRKIIEYDTSSIRRMDHVEGHANLLNKLADKQEVKFSCMLDL